MVNEEQAKKIQAEELARQNAPSRRCGRLLRVDKDGMPHTCPQIVKVGTLCPACGVRVE